MRPRFVVAACASSGVLACAAITGVGDLDEVACPGCVLEGGVPDTSRLDGAPGPVEAGQDTAQDFDVTPGDDVAPPSKDATGVDARLPDAEGGAADVTALGWCASQPSHTLCTDFDESAALPPPGWTIDTSGALDFSVDTAQFTSSPHSFLSGVPGGSGAHSARLAWTASGAPASISWAFDVRLHTVGPPPESHVAEIAFGDASHKAQIIVTQPMTGLTASLQIAQPDADGGLVYTNHAFSTLPALDTWVRIQLSVTLSQSIATVAVTMNQAVVVAATALPGSFVGPVPTLYLGTFSSSPAGAFEFNYDDVTIDAK